MRQINQQVPSKNNLALSKLNSFFFDSRCRRIIKSAVRSQSFRVELLASAAMQAAAISCFSLNKRTTNVVVPAAEKFGHQTHFLTENKSVNLIGAPGFSAD